MFTSLANVDRALLNDSALMATRLMLPLGPSISVVIRLLKKMANVSLRIYKKIYYQLCKFFGQLFTTKKRDLRS